jgi:hypothetical protein
MRAKAGGKMDGRTKRHFGIDVSCAIHAGAFHSKVVAGISSGYITSARAAFGQISGGPDEFCLMGCYGKAQATSHRTCYITCQPRKTAKPARRQSASNTRLPLGVVADVGNGHPWDNWMTRLNMPSEGWLSIPRIGREIRFLFGYGNAI